MTEICVPWVNSRNILWSKVCSNIVEHFGLPGNKYTTEVSTDEMKFFFKDDREALMCKILISDSI